MKRSTFAALAAPGLLLAACNVTDNNNGSSTISLDEDRIEQGTEALANEASKAGAKAANAVENAGPAIEQSAADIQERAGRVAGKAEALGEEVERDVDASVTTPAEANKAR